MDHTYILACFSLGVLVAAPLGPLALLMFNRGARRGFVAGFVTGLGAVTGDIIFAVLGLAGLLQPLLHGWVKGAFFRIGGGVLCVLGFFFFKRRTQIVRPQRDTLSRYSRMWLQGFLLTLSNPLVALFFIAAGLEVLTATSTTVTWYTLGIGVLAVGVGSVTVVASISMLGVFLGARLADRHIVLLQTGASLLLLLVGISLLTGLMSYYRYFFSQLQQLFSSAFQLW